MLAKMLPGRLEALIFTDPPFESHPSLEIRINQGLKYLKHKTFEHRITIDKMTGMLTRKLNMGSVQDKYL